MTTAVQALALVLKVPVRPDGLPSPEERRLPVVESLVEYSPGQHRDARGRWNAGFARASDQWNSTQLPLARASVARWQSTYEDCRQMQENPDSAMSRQFADAVERSPKTQGSVYRGFDEYRGTKKLSLEQARTKWEGKIGKRIEMNVPTSATPDIGMAAGFGKVIFEITGGEARDISALSSMPSFKESILKPGTFGVARVRQGPDIPNSDSPFRTDTSPTIVVSLVSMPNL